MTEIAHHLKCDCKKAVNAYYCPVGILKPTVSNNYDYHHCSYCKMDYICDHSIKIKFLYNDSGLPEQTEIVCGKCGNPLEAYQWPKQSDKLDEGTYKTKYVSIYRRNY
ncbi:MAG: hypothetical protein ACTSVO_04135 [Candidatus Heimdallarchaeaceae archaeon]